VFLELPFAQLIREVTFLRSERRLFYGGDPRAMNCNLTYPHMRLNAGFGDVSSTAIADPRRNPNAPPKTGSEKTNDEARMPNDEGSPNKWNAEQIERDAR